MPPDNNQTQPVAPMTPPAPEQAPQGTATPPGQDNASSPKSVASPNSTQNSLLISEIRDGMVIMGDGSFRAIVACKSINFDLMSSREREGVEYSYQNFLNALYFPVQILIRSQRVDIGPYIDRLSTIRRSQDNMLLNVLMDDYIEFIDILSQEANIMDKSFFVVIPYYPTGNLDNAVEQSKSFFTRLLPKSGKTVTKIDEDTYSKAKDEIKNRVDAVVGGLYQIGVQCVQLKTKEVGELYYNIYNPDTAVREPLGDFDSVATTFVRKGAGEAPRPHLDQGGM